MGRRLLYAQGPHILGGRSSRGAVPNLLHPDTSTAGRLCDYLTSGQEYRALAGGKTPARQCESLARLSGEPEGQVIPELPPGSHDSPRAQTDFHSASRKASR